MGAQHAQHINVTPVPGYMCTNTRLLRCQGAGMIPTQAARS
jgi:hypothetical protein